MLLVYTNSRLYFVRCVNIRIYMHCTLGSIALYAIGTAPQSFTSYADSHVHLNKCGE